MPTTIASAGHVVEDEIGRRHVPSAPGTTSNLGDTGDYTPIFHRHRARMRRRGLCRRRRRPWTDDVVTCDKLFFYETPAGREAECELNLNDM
jgi:hypothetical protein